MAKTSKFLCIWASIKLLVKAKRADFLKQYLRMFQVDSRDKSGRFNRNIETPRHIESMMSCNEFNYHAIILLVQPARPSRKRPRGKKGGDGLAYLAISSHLILQPLTNEIRFLIHISVLCVME